MRSTCFILFVASASAFHNGALTTKVKSCRSSSNGILLFADAAAKQARADTATSYGEESRKYRRTVYTHDDWVNHRSPDRFIRNIRTTVSSGIYKNVGREVTAVVSVAVAVMLWNMATISYTDFQGVTHEAVWKNLWAPSFTIPMQAYTLPSSFLGLLLGEWYSPLSSRALSQRANHSLIVSFIIISISNQRGVQEMGRGPQKLGNEYQSHPRLGTNGQCVLRRHWSTGRTTHQRFGTSFLVYLGFCPSYETPLVARGRG